VLRVDTPPSWETPGSGNRPPTNPSDFGSFLGALASHAKGQVWAYEIWNEPNLSSEWGNQPPNPAAYVALLQAAYPAIKAADPAAFVITAGLVTTGGDGGVTSLNVRFYSIVNSDGSPRPAYTALSQMTKSIR